METLAAKNDFTIVWKVKNFSMCASKKIISPSVFIEIFEKTTWCLRLFPNFNYENKLLCSLVLEDYSTSECGVFIVDCSMSIVSVDNALNIVNIKPCCSFKDNENHDFIFGSLGEIVDNRDVLLPNDTLTIRCCLRKFDSNIEYPIVKIPSEKEIVQSKESTTDDVPKATTSDFAKSAVKSVINHVHFVDADTLDNELSEEIVSAKKLSEDSKWKLLPNAYTILMVIPLERRCKLWEIKKFNEIAINQKIFTSIGSAGENFPFILSLHKSKREDCCDTNIQMDIQRHPRKREECFVKFILTILNKFCEEQNRFEHCYFFDDEIHVCILPPIQMSELCMDHLLKDASLLLRVELIISYEACESVSTELVTSFPSVLIWPNVKDMRDLGIKFLRTSKYDEFSDVVLHCGQKSFCVNKAILSASSPYFRGLFEKDLKEPCGDDSKDDFELKFDVDPNTLEDLLEYVHSGILRKLDLDHVIALFIAAKKFKVVDLEKDCSCIIRSGLDVSNVCDVLSVADCHEDKVLKVAAMTFISAFADEVFHSTKWKSFMESNAKIAGEAMHNVLTTKFVPQSFSLFRPVFVLDEINLNELV